MSILQRPSRGRLVRASASARRQKMVGRLGPWHLLGVLGEGPLTRVYLARPQDSHRDAEPAYALKLLRRRWHDCRPAIETLRREWLVGQRVDDCHVVPVISAHLEQPPYYVVFPRLAGATLGESLAGGGRPSLALALWLTRQAAEGLQAIHAACGMVHGDVKPSNLFISPSSHATLIDLGFARSQRENRAWAARPVLGTPNYVAPEAITSSLAADVRSDIYSLGVTLYEMLSGHLPFAADDLGALAAMHRSQRPRCIREESPRVPKPVASLVHTMICKQPLRRPQDYEELITRLEELEIRFFAARSDEQKLRQRAAS